jgi:hypothetical protein
MRGWGGWVAGSQPMSTAEYSCTYGAQINFGDLTPYLTYGPTHVISLLLTKHWISGAGLLNHMVGEVSNFRGTAKEDDSGS